MPDLNWEPYHEPEPAAVAVESPAPALTREDFALAFWEQLVANPGHRFMVRGFRPEWVRRELEPYEDRFLGAGRSPDYVLHVEERFPVVLVGLKPFVCPPGWTWEK